MKFLPNALSAILNAATAMVHTPDTGHNHASLPLPQRTFGAMDLARGSDSKIVKSAGGEQSGAGNGGKIDGGLTEVVVPGAGGDILDDKVEIDGGTALGHVDAGGLK